MTDDVMNRILQAERDAADRISSAKRASADAVAQAEADAAMKIASAETLGDKALKAAKQKAKEKSVGIIERHEDAALADAERIIREASANLEKAIAAVAGEIMSYGTM